VLQRNLDVPRSGKSGNPWAGPYSDIGGGASTHAIDFAARTPLTRIVAEPCGLEARAVKCAGPGPSARLLLRATVRAVRAAAAAGTRRHRGTAQAAGAARNRTVSFLPDAQAHQMIREGQPLCDPPLGQSHRSGYRSDYGAREDTASNIRIRPVAVLSARVERPVRSGAALRSKCDLRRRAIKIRRAVEPTPP